MLYLGKAHGQKRPDGIRVPTIWQTLIIGLFLTYMALPTIGLADEIVLEEIRLGDHGEYVRIVFQFSAPVQYKLTEDDSDGSVSMVFPDTTLKDPDSRVAVTPECVAGLSTKQEGTQAIATVSLKPIGARLNTFSIREPDRIVLDVFCPEETALIVTPAVPAQPPVEPPKITTPETIEPEKEPAPEVNALPSVERPPTKKKDNFQNYLLILLAGITLVIILLIGLIIVQKRSLSGGPAANEQVSAVNTDEIMRDLDSRIKEKLMKYDE